MKSSAPCHLPSLAALALLATALPSLHAAPLTLNGSNGDVWTVWDGESGPGVGVTLYEGELNGTQGDALDFFDLQVGGNSYTGTYDAGSSTPSRIVGTVQNLNGFDASIVVELIPTRPAVRQIVTLENTTGTELTQNLLWEINWGSDLSTVFHTTSSGDANIAVDDFYCVTDDNGDPALTANDPTNITYWGDGSALQPDSIIQPFTGLLQLSYQVTLAPGQRVKFLLGHEMATNGNAGIAAAPAGLASGDFLAGLSAQDRVEVVNWAGRPGRVLLIEDQGGFGNAAGVLTANGFNVTVVNNEFANGYANLLDAGFLGQFDFIVYGERGASGAGSVLPTNVKDSLEAYIQSGGHLLCTGYDALFGPTDPAMAALVRSTGTLQSFGLLTTWKVSSDNLPMINGPFADLRGQVFVSPTGYDFSLNPDLAAGAVEIVSSGDPRVTGKVIFTDLPGAGGSVGFWNGGGAGTATNAQPEFSNGTSSQDFFLNYAAMAVGRCERIERVLYYRWSTTPSAPTAMQNLGLQVTTVNQGLSQTLPNDLSPYDLLVIENDVDFIPTQERAKILAFIAAGRPVIMNYWDYNSNPDLQAAFEATVATNITGPAQIDAWDPSHPVFAGVTNPLVPIGDNGGNDNGDKLTPTGSAVALAGYTAAPAAGEAAIVLGNNGRTIVNGFAPDDFTNADMVRLFQNQIRFLDANHNTGHVLLVNNNSNGGGFAPAVPDLLTSQGYTVTVVNDEISNSHANLLDAGFLADFDFIVYNTTNIPPASVTTSLENYIQAGGHLLVTGYDTSFGSIPQLTRNATPGDLISLNPDWGVSTINHPILNGPYGDFRGQSFTATGYDDDLVSPDLAAGAVELVATGNPRVTSKIIFTDLPGAAGSVGYWNGGTFSTSGQTDFTDGNPPQSIFLNWVAYAASCSGREKGAEIAVEYPVSTDLVNGLASINAGTVLAGEQIQITVRNKGIAPLVGLSASLSGTDAGDMSTNSLPTSVPITGSTTFNLVFDTGGATAKNAVLSILSNDGDESPFNISVTAIVQTDSDGDGLYDYDEVNTYGTNPGLWDTDGDGASDGGEIQFAALGFTNGTDDSALLAQIQGNGGGLGLNTAAGIQAAASGSPVIQKDPASGTFVVAVGLLNSPDLSTPFVRLTGYPSPVSNPGTGELFIEFPPPSPDKHFFKVFGDLPLPPP